MPGDLQIKYGLSSQPITLLLANLADGDKVVSDEISNASDLFHDAFVQLKVKTGAAGVSTTGVLYVYTVGSADGGVSYPDSENNEKRPIGIIKANANAATFVSELMSVAAAFNGKLPERWKLVVKNQTGAALDATEGDHSKFYQGVFGQYTG